MNPFEMVVIIVIICAIASVFKARHGVVKDRLGNDVYVGTDNDAENARLQDEVTTLKERIAVLERLATDDQRSIELDREIAKLRDSSKV